MNKENFICPTLDLDGELHPNFSHIKELYTTGLGKLQKMAYKLTDKVLNPQVIEKTNVKLADACLPQIYYKRFKSTTQTMDSRKQHVSLKFSVNGLMWYM